ncbi:helix-turn-helix domain-containing protein [Micromonospora sp. NPDC049559]|uniref:helix-turn-helix domain-containing protein n=1 Tax=Micromonospora sp. NPDC049559 TaxID=3155923 RepID=UPI0034422021
MTASDFGVDPTAATGPEQYVALLRRVRVQSGLTYRAIARRAQRDGKVLPPSTLATMLGRPTLPRRDLVSAMLRACEVPHDRAVVWLAVWSRLAAARSAAYPRRRPAAGGTPVEAPRAPQRHERAPLPRATAGGGPSAGAVTAAAPTAYGERAAVLRLVPGERTVGPSGAGERTVGPAGAGRGRVPGARPPHPRRSSGADPHRAGADPHRLRVGVRRGEDGWAPPVPYQLPPAPPLLVGREAEIERLAGAVATDGAVCVVEGAGGVGKSALALHVAHRIAGRYRGGCLYVDLRAAYGVPPVPGAGLLAAGAGLPMAGPTEVLHRLLRALGVPAGAASPDEASALLRTCTAGRGVLVLLDNATSAAQVRPLLLSGPGCATIVTSRPALADLDATARVHLAPLPHDAALDLFAELAGADRVAAEPAAAATVVRACGGLPLALRIVGARAAVRLDAPLVALAERIADEARRLDVLQLGDLSVRASLDLAYRAFAEAAEEEPRRAARLFRLAALPDWTHLTPYGCAALVGLPPCVAERALDALADAHLVEPAGGGRYRFPDLVRLYARERAELVDAPSEREEALARLRRMKETFTPRR